jgi:hypothetical protein
MFWHNILYCKKWVVEPMVTFGKFNKKKAKNSLHLKKYLMLLGIPLTRKEHIDKSKFLISSLMKT